MKRPTPKTDLSLKSESLTYKSYNIIQIMPSNGWHCFSAYELDGTIKFYEQEFVGWALAYQRTQTWNADNDRDEADVDDVSDSASVIPIIYRSDLDTALPLDESENDAANAIMAMFPPDSNLDQAA